MRYSTTRSAGYMLNLAARTISHRTGELLAPLGVSPAYLPILFELAEVGRSTQAELADRVSIVAPTMARTLHRMERDGLVARAVDAADRRRAIVTLTEHAKTLIPQIEAIALAMNEKALAGIGDSNEMVLLDALNRIVDNLRPRAQESGTVRESRSGNKRTSAERL